jgi:CspA family cold shock protein
LALEKCKKRRNPGKVFCGAGWLTPPNLKIRAQSSIWLLLLVASDGFSALCGSFFLLASPSTGEPIGGSPQPKEELTMITGTVKFFNADKGYGFIQPEDGSGDAFVHISAVEAAGMQTLDRDQRVQYELEEDRRGRVSAVRLQSA